MTSASDEEAGQAELRRKELRQAEYQRRKERSVPPRYTRLAGVRLAVLITPGIVACGHNPDTELPRVEALPDQDYVMAVEAYLLAAVFGAVPPVPKTARQLRRERELAESPELAEPSVSSVPGCRYAPAEICAVLCNHCQSHPYPAAQTAAAP